VERGDEGGEDAVAGSFGDGDMEVRAESAGSSTVVPF
jgi:hypothetical protein